MIKKLKQAWRTVNDSLSLNGRSALLAAIHSKLMIDRTHYPMVDQLYPEYVGIHIHYYKSFGKFPCLIKPVAFSEKIQLRKLFDRNPIFNRVTDRLTARQLVQEKKLEHTLIPLLWQGTNPAKIPFDTLPSHYVIKTNHGCGFNIFCKNKQLQKIQGKKLIQLTREDCINQLQDWLSVDYYYYTGEWAYKDIEPQIIIETLLTDTKQVSPPYDYKFHCFKGKVQYIQLVRNRFEGLVDTMYDAHWNLQNFTCKTQPSKKPEDKPEELTTMIEFCEKITQDIDYLRVDIYLVDSKIYFGEICVYPANGTLRFFPHHKKPVFQQRDETLGAKWDIKPLIAYAKAASAQT